MAYSINAEIPLQGKQVDLSRGIDLFQQAQTNAANLEKHRFEMQKLREDYDLAKEKRKQEKAMSMGIASDLNRITEGSPAQYAPTRFEQTPQRGQMPQGMTGVMMREQGKQMPQPQAFGEEILQGNFNPNGGGEVTQEAVAGREPSYLEQLQIAAKRALQVGDVESAFKYTQAMQQQRVAEREQNAPVGNPYPTYDAQGNFVGTRVMTKAGQEIPFGAQGTTTVKPDVLTTKDKLERDFQERKFRAEQEKAAKELALKERELNKTKPDPVEKALSIVEGKEQIKARYAQTKEVAQKYADADDVIPLLDVYISQLKKTPKTAVGRGVENVLGAFGAGNTEQQDAVTASQQTAKTLINYAQKQPGPSTDADVKNYLEQVGIASNPLVSRSGQLAAAESAKAYALSIKAKYGKYSSDILSGKVVPDELKQEQPVDKKALYNDFLKGRAMLRGNPAALKQYDDAARADGIIK
jgi:hypothetical protein